MSSAIRQDSAEKAMLAWDVDARLVGSAADGQAARTYGYDPDGRRTLTSTTSAELQLLSYDQRGLLSGVRNGDSSAATEAREHDGDGVLVNYTSPGAALDIVWDPTLDTPQISDVRVGTNGAVLIARASQVISFGYFQDGEQLGGGVYTYDAHGSYINNTNWPAPTDYSPYGEPVDLPAGSPVQGAYRGEMTISGLLHLRNRDYDPATGSFTTPDPLDGIDGTPTVGNPYHYGDNDPTNRTDPLGLSPTDGEGPNCGGGGFFSLSCTLGFQGPPTLSPDALAALGLGGGGYGLSLLCVSLPLTCLIVGGLAAGALLGTAGFFAYQTLTDNPTSGPGTANPPIARPTPPTAVTDPTTTALPPPIIDIPDTDDDDHGCNVPPGAIGKYSTLSRANRGAGHLCQAHHIIQNAAVRDVDGYSYSTAPAIILTREGHAAATAVQRRPQIRGTYGAEKNVAREALDAAGMSWRREDAIDEADRYFVGSLGIYDGYPTRLPGR